MATSDQKTKPQKPQPPIIAKDNKNSHLVLYQTKITSKKYSLNNKKIINTHTHMQQLHYLFI